MAGPYFLAKEKYVDTDIVVMTADTGMTQRNPRNAKFHQKRPELTESLRGPDSLLTSCSPEEIHPVGPFDFRTVKIFAKPPGSLYYDTSEIHGTITISAEQYSSQGLARPTARGNGR